MRNRRETKNKAAADVSSEEVETGEDQAAETVSTDSEADPDQTNMEASETPVVLDVECGPNNAKFHLDKVQMGSKGQCVFFEDAWLTPNEFQFVSGRETAKDWKRSIKHHDKSLKLLMAKGFLSLTPPECCCEFCLEKSSDEKCEEADDVEQENVPPATDPSPSPQSDKDSPCKDATSVTLPEDEEILGASRTKAKSRRRSRDASPKTRRKRRTKKHQRSRDLAGSNTNILKLKRVEDSEEYVASVVGPDKSLDGTTDTDTTPDRTLSNKDRNDSKDTQVVDKLSTVDEDSDVDPGHVTEETDEYELDGQDIGNKEMDTENDSVVCQADGRDVKTESCEKDTAINMKPDIKLNESMHFSFKDVPSSEKESNNKEDRDTGKILHSTGAKDCSQESTVLIQSNHVVCTEYNPGQDLNNHLNGKGKQEFTDGNPLLNMTVNTLMSTDAGNSERDNDKGDNKRQFAEGEMGVDVETDGQERVLAEHEVHDIESNIDQQETHSSYEKISVHQKDSTNSHITEPSQPQAMTEAPVKCIDDSPIPTLAARKNRQLFENRLHNKEGDTNQTESLNFARKIEEPQKDICPKKDPVVPIEHFTEKKERESLTTNLPTIGTNACSQIPVQTTAVCPPEPHQGQTNNAFVQDIPQNTSPSPDTSKDDIKQTSTTDDNVLTPTKEARLTSIINQLRTYKKQLNRNIDEQKNRDSHKLELTMTGEMSSAQPSFGNDPTGLLPMTSSQSNPRDSINKTKSPSTLQTEVKAVPPSIVRSHDRSEKAKVSRNKVKDGSDKLSLSQLTNWPVVLSESMKVASPSTGSPSTASLVSTGSGSSVPGASVSSGLGAGLSLPFMTYPYLLPGMMPHGVLPTTSALPGCGTLPASTALPGCGSLPASSALSGFTGMATVPTTSVSPAAFASPMLYSSLYGMYPTLAANIASGGLGATALLAQSGLGLGGQVNSSRCVANESSKDKKKYSESSRDEAVPRKRVCEPQARAAWKVRSSRCEATADRTPGKYCQPVHSQTPATESRQRLPKSLDFSRKGSFAYDEHGALDLTSSLKRPAHGYHTGHVVKKRCLKPESPQSQLLSSDLQSMATKKMNTYSSHSKSRVDSSGKPAADTTARDLLRKYRNHMPGIQGQIRSSQGRVSDRSLKTESSVKGVSAHITRSPIMTTSTLSTATPGAASMSSMYASSLYDLATPSSALAAAHAATVAAVKDYPAGSPYAAALAAGINPAVLGLMQHPFYNPYSM